MDSSPAYFFFGGGARRNIREASAVYAESNNPRFLGSAGARENAASSALC
jgi:hypothetical protein